MREVPVQDSRRYFVLPQAPEGAFYYTYGTPGRGAGQYSSARMLTFIFHLEHRWGAIQNRKIGIGNISLANGAAFPPHRSHRSGLEVDIRPIRKDGQQLPVRYTDSQYDQDATRELVELIWQTGMVRRVAFNDVSLSRVQGMPGHDDHLHVEIIAEGDK
nr:penicillin-insensitive murein endopeptidase [Aromatoleum tolulyticum]